MNEENQKTHFGDKAYCQKCGVHRLSKADLRYCMFCEEEGIRPSVHHPERIDQYAERNRALDRYGPICSCGRGEIEHGHFCNECNAERAEAERKKRDDEECRKLYPESVSLGSRWKHARNGRIGRVLEVSDCYIWLISEEPGIGTQTSGRNSRIRKSAFLMYYRKER